MSPRYSLGKYDTAIAVGFGATAVPLTAHSLWRDDDGTVHREEHPVVGFVVEHQVDSDGVVVGGTTSPAVWFPDYGEATNVSVFNAGNEGLIGVYPTGHTPPEGDVKKALRDLEVKAR